MSLRWSGALAWRLQRQLLDPVGHESVPEVVRRLVAVPAQSIALAELAVGGRRVGSRTGEVDRALDEGALIKTYAFRGATHFLTPEEGGIYLALRAASRMWELPSWQSYYDLKPTDWPALREATRDALENGPLTRGELAAAISAQRRFAQLGPAIAEGSDTLLKPLAWQGDLSFGPAVGGEATFQRLDRNPRWAGVPDLEDAGPRAVEAYLRAYGPTTPEHVHRWLGNGLGAGRKRIRSWIAGLADRIEEVEIEGDRVFLLAEDLDDLTAARTSHAVRLLPGYDQWVLGPGTDDPRVVPPRRRSLLSRQANIVVTGGVVTGTWTRRDDQVTVSWFSEPPKPVRKALSEEVDRIGAILGRPLHLVRGSGALDLGEVR